MPEKGNKKRKKTLLYRVLRKLRTIAHSQQVYSAMMALCRILPVQKKVVFSSYGGKEASDNPYAIFEEMRKSDAWRKYRFIWLMQDKQRKVEGAKVVSYHSLNACYHLATARLWVSNTRKSPWEKKRKNQYYVQTWHGGIPLKAVEKDVEDKLSPEYVVHAKYDSTIADLFIAGSEWQVKRYRSAFWYDGEILECGQPRYDILFQPPAPVLEKVYQFFHIPAGVKLMIYAPTFRNIPDVKAYDLDCHQVLRVLEKRFGGEWKALVRMHPNVLKLHNAYPYDDEVLDASLYPGIDDLIIASDWLITDYSGCIFEALEAGKYGAIYAPDMDEYVRERSFYWDLRKLPFVFAQTNGELCCAIEQLDTAEYARNAERFKEECGFFDDGHAAQRVVEYLTAKII